MWALAQWPSGDDKAHPFQPFHKRMIRIQTLIIYTYFLEYTKMVNIIHICTKNGKYCTNFVNVYKICQFLCVNVQKMVNLHCN